MFLKQKHKEIIHKYNYSIQSDQNLVLQKFLMEVPLETRYV